VWLAVTSPITPEKSMCISNHNRVLLCKLDNDGDWSIIGNPTHDFFSLSMNDILLNAANDYVEYRNCGVLHRMIRYEDLEKYGINKSHVKPEHTLKPASLM
jgi:hypothetical protein